MQVLLNAVGHCLEADKGMHSRWSANAISGFSQKRIGGWKWIVLTYLNEPRYHLKLSSGLTRRKKEVLDTAFSKVRCCVVFHIRQGERMRFFGRGLQNVLRGSSWGLPVYVFVETVSDKDHITQLLSGPVGFEDRFV